MSEIPELWEHQKEAIRKAGLNSHFALYFPVGCGKSRTAVELLRNVFNHEQKYLRTIILCPIIIVRQWREEILKYSKIPASKIRCLTGHNKKRVDGLKDFDGIIVTNWESLIMPNFFSALLEWEPGVVVADELHKAKSVESKRSKALWKLGQVAKYRYGLTGTPALQGPMDLFSQFKFLDQGKIFGQNFYSFRHRFFEDKNARMPKHCYFPDFQPKKGIEEEIRRLIDPVSISVRKEECISLPPLVTQKVYVELSEEQRKLYDELKSDFITYVGSEACKADLAITKLLRLQEIISNFVSLESSDPLSPGRKKLQLKISPREKALEELLEANQAQSKIIVWCCFRQNYAQVRAICDKLKIKWVEVTGDTPASKRQESVDAFNNDAEVRVFISNPSAGGVGLHLAVSDLAVFYSRTFSLEHKLQAEGRNYRAGSDVHKSVTHVDIVASDTIDEFILKRLEEKQNLSERLIYEIAEEIQKSKTNTQ